MAKKTQNGVWTTPDRTDRPNPFGVQWRETAWSDEDSKVVKRVRTEYFPTAKARDERAASLRKDKKAGAMATATRQEIAEWRAFLTMVNPTPWQDVVAGWKAWLNHSGLSQNVIKVEEAVKLALAHAEKLTETTPPSLSKDTFRQKRHKLNLFAEQFGHLRMNEVKGIDVEEWIEDFDEVKSEATFNAYKKIISALFTPYVEKGDIRRNPIADVKLRDDNTGKVGILTPQQAAKLFHYAHVTPKFNPVIGRLALEAFVGLRYSSGVRLAKEDIKEKEKGILLPKHKMKTKTRHYIDGMPDQVWDWLAITPEGCWALTPRQYMQLKSDLFTEAGVPHPHNCLRHSFCTYDVAAHKNPGRTAYILCHTDQELLWRRYKGNATQSDGLLYQTITPATALEVAEGKPAPSSN